MSALTNPEPQFVAEQRNRMTSAQIDVRGVDESWVAPFALFDAPEGFGEEAWFSASPNSVIAWRIEGSEVVAEWGRNKGKCSGFGRFMALQPQGTPNHYRAPGPSRFAQFYLTDQLLTKVADDHGFARPTHGLLREDLVFFHDDALHRALNEYAMRSQAGKEQPTRIEMEARAILIVDGLLRRHHVVGRRALTGGIAPHALRRVTEYLMAHLAEEVALAELASIAHLSPHHFCRAFKQSTGLPPHAWLTARRIERAQEMIAAHPDMGLTEIALSVGYASQAAFGVAFKRITGLSPGQWRRERLG